MAHFHGHEKLKSRPKGLSLDLKILVLAVRKVLGKARPRGFKRLYASSLAFKTVLALVPALAIIMAVLAGDRFSDKRELLLDQIVDIIYPVDAVNNDTSLDPAERQSLQQLNQAGKQQIRRSVQKFANHAHKAGMAGLVGFAFVVLLLLRDVEGSFNFLWGLEKGRPWASQALRHVLFVIGAPLMGTLVLSMKGLIKAVGLFKPMTEGWFFTEFIPFVILWAFCAGIYLWIPNTKVDRKSAIWTGFLVALLLELAQGIMNWYTLHVLATSRVYGALWVIPMILIWFYLSWTVILFGAEVAFYMQRERLEERR